MRAMVVYSSNTGNTRKIASAIFAAIPGDSKDMQHIDEYRGKDADTFFVGFCTDKGNCDIQVANLLNSLHGKTVALFGTCGMGKDDAYYARITEQVRKWLPADNTYAGAFMCQGKMPMKVRNGYERLLKCGKDKELMQHLIRNFDEALLHPDRDDELAAAAFAKEVMAVNYV